MPAVWSYVSWGYLRERVGGVPTPGSMLKVYTHPPDEEAETYTTAGPDGSWEADFHGLCDIESGTSVEVEEWDDDGDTTHVTWPWSPSSPGPYSPVTPQGRSTHISEFLRRSSRRENAGH
jgi:hypothetical protein